jgi:hypothetical protein
MRSAVPLDLVMGATQLKPRFELSGHCPHLMLCSNSSSFYQLSTQVTVQLRYTLRHQAKLQRKIQLHSAFHVLGLFRYF